jgi:hypothetical protein
MYLVKDKKLRLPHCFLSATESSETVESNGRIALNECRKSVIIAFNECIVLKNV